MESWIERASRGVVRIGAAVLLVCLTLSSSMPTPTFNVPTQSTDSSSSEMSWDVKAAVTVSKNLSRMVESSNGGVVLSTVQTSGENRISTRMRRMSSRKTRDNGIYSFDIKQLHCKNGNLLAIYDNETINGTRDRFDKYSEYQPFPLIIYC